MPPRNPEYSTVLSPRQANGLCHLIQPSSSYFSRWEAARDAEWKMWSQYVDSFTFQAGNVSLFIILFYPKSFPDGVSSAASPVQNSSSSTGSYVPPTSSSAPSQQANSLVPEIKIREWVWTAANPYRHPEIVTAVPVGWPVPTVHRLWFGTSLGKKI